MLDVYAMLRLYLIILHSTYCIGRCVMNGTVHKDKKTGGAFSLLFVLYKRFVLYDDDLIDRVYYYFLLHYIAFQ